MNLAHRLCCDSTYWARTVRDKTALTAVEIDEQLAKRLVSKYGDRARIIQGDGTELQFADGEFTSAVCFTMLHHVPTPPLQDQMFAEVFRVLTPGGVFAGTDGVPSTSFRVMHLLDTYNPVSPVTLPDRLTRAGFTDIHTEVTNGQQRWRALKPS